jgi:hypothetical protein
LTATRAHFPCTSATFFTAWTASLPVSQRKVFSSSSSIVTDFPQLLVWGEMFEEPPWIYFWM